MNNEALRRALAFIHPWLRLRYEGMDVPGFQVAVAHEGRILLNEAYGYADLERQTALRPDHIFRIASHSKTFTATAIMMLQEEGRLHIDDPVVRYLPWLAGHSDSRWSEVSIRHLLSHGASVIRDGLDANFWQLLRPFPDDDGFREEVMGVPLVADVNLRLKYSNYGYTLLGRVIEAAAGVAYNDFVQDRIVASLGLSDTHPEYRPGHGGLEAERVVTGYSRKMGGRRIPIAPIDTRAMSPATGFCSTASDLVRYFTAHMVGSHELLSDASKKEMQKVQWHAVQPGAEQEAGDYGLGLSLARVGRRQTFGHGGGFPGHITNSKADPSGRMVVVALTNSLDGPAGQIVNGIYKICDYFADNAPDAALPDLSDVEGFYEQLWSASAVLAAKDGLNLVSPDQWEPFQSMEKLKYIAPDTFCIVEADSYASLDESVRVVRREGRIESISFAGGTAWPRAEWHRRLQNLNRIG
jgi:CubicO group peptidase (beta-lactamase class C family)